MLRYLAENNGIMMREEGGETKRFKRKKERKAVEIFCELFFNNI